MPIDQEAKPAAWFVASGIAGAIFTCLGCLAVLTHALPIG